MPPGKLTIDFESRSAKDLKKCGCYVYAADPSTEIICLALKKDNQPPKLWIPDYFKNILFCRAAKKEISIGTQAQSLDIFKKTTLVSSQTVNRLVTEADIVEAHNANFERQIWKQICQKQYNWPGIPLEKWRCSAAKAAASCLPRGLDAACKALNLPVLKDSKGHALMLKMTKPRKLTYKQKKLIDPLGPKTHWHEEPDDLFRLFLYCLQDVKAEYCLSENTRDLPSSEQETWRLDQVINDRGFAVDIDLCEKAQILTESFLSTAKKDIAKLTDGYITSPTQRERILKFVNAKGADLPNLQKATVTEYLEDENPHPLVREVLDIRMSASKASNSKYKAFRERSTIRDQRFRGGFIYHGAGTGRWAGKGVQPHNLKRPAFSDMENMAKAVKTLDVDWIETLFGMRHTEVMANGVRGAIIAPPGKKFYQADLAAIEGRVLAWLAGETSILHDYAVGKDPYKVFAAVALGKPYKDITKAERNKPGKVGELACGFGGGPSAARVFGAEGTDEHISKTVIRPWRNSRKKTVSYWYETEEMAKLAIRKPGQIISQGRNIKWLVRNNFLYCRLPSGRLLSYYQPHIGPAEVPWGVNEKSILFWGADSISHKWVKKPTFGGKLVENKTQAVARDVFVCGMHKIEQTGYPIVMHTHDEVLAEVPITENSLPRFIRGLTTQPRWAQDLPLAAEGWEGERYRK